MTYQQQGTNYEVTLEWDAVLDQGVAGYNLYRSETAGGPYVKANADLIPGLIYTDSYSDVVPVVTADFDGTNVTLSWTDVGLAPYKVERSEDQETWVEVASGNGPSYLDRRPNDGRTWWYRIGTQAQRFYVATAVNEGGLESNNSNEVVATIEAVSDAVSVDAGIPPDPPSGLRVTGQGIIALLEWRKDPKADHYEILRQNLDWLTLEPLGGWTVVGRSQFNTWADWKLGPRLYSVRSVYLVKGEMLDAVRYRP